MRDFLASLGVVASLLVAACLDDPRDTGIIKRVDEEVEPRSDEECLSDYAELDKCTYSLKRSSCSATQCCKLKTCCVTINGQRICQTTRADCVPVLREVNP